MTRAMSSATRATRGSISRSGDFSSSGTTRPTGVSLASARPRDHKDAQASAARCAASRGRAMIELVRTNDLVLISFVESVLTQAGVRFFVADNHMSAVEGSLGFLPRRILVDADQHARARQSAARGRPVARTQRWLSGGDQPRRDPRRPAAAAPEARRPSRRARRDPARRGGGRRRSRGSPTSAPGSARSAWRCCSVGRRRRATWSRSTPSSRRWREENAALNGLADARPRRRRRRARPKSRRAAGLVDEAADLVVANPPYLAAAAARVSPDARRARAHVAGGGRGGARRLGRRLSGAARAGRALRHDPARRRAAGAAAGLRRPARRRRAAPRPPARRRAGDPAADFRDQGLEGAACASCPA